MRAGVKMEVGDACVWMLVWRGRSGPRAFRRCRHAGGSAGATRSVLALRRHWYLGGFGSSARHGGDACALLWRSLGRCGRWLRMGCSLDQPQGLANFGIELGHGVFVVFEELAGVFAALADAFAFVAEPGAGFFEDIVVDGDIEQVAFARNAFAVQDVELSLAEGRGNFVLYHFHPGARAGDYVAFLDRGDTAVIHTTRCNKIQCPAPF